MDWIDVKKTKPNVNELGNGNVCEVKVKYIPEFNKPSEGTELFGTSGFMNEPLSFFGLRGVTHWKPIN